VRTAIAEALPIDFRLIGGSLVEDSQSSWTARFLELGISMQPPVYDSAELAAHYA
jgi:hypothetical protein